jgi:hypothetical protein
VVSGGELDSHLVKQSAGREARRKGVDNLNISCNMSPRRIRLWSAATAAIGEGIQSRENKQ